MPRRGVLDRHRPRTLLENNVTKTRPLALSAAVAIAFGSFFVSSAAAAAPETDRPVASVPVCPTESQGLPTTVNEITEGDHFANGEVPEVLTGWYEKASSADTLRIQIQSESTGRMVLEDDFSVSGGSWSYDISDVPLADENYFLRIEAPGTEPGPGLLLKLSFSVGEPAAAPKPTIEQISEGKFFLNGDVPAVLSGTYAEASDDGNLVIQVVDEGQGDEEASLMLHDEFAVSGGTWRYDLSDITFADSKYMIMVGVPSGISHSGTEVHFCVGDFLGNGDDGEVIVDAPNDEGTEFVDGTEFDESGAPTELTGTGTPGATVGVVLTGSTQITGTTTVAEDGTWSFALDEPLPVGEYALDITQTAEGTETQRVSVSFSVTADETADTDTSTDDTATDDTGTDTSTDDTGTDETDTDTSTDDSGTDTSTDGTSTDSDDTDTSTDGTGTDSDDTDTSTGTDETGTDASTDDTGTDDTVTDDSGTDTGTDRETEEPTGTDVEVTTATHETDSTGTDELAVTGGSSTLPYAIGAAGLMLAGGASLLIARRTRA